MKKRLHEIYLDWVNNWGSLSKMADHYGVDCERMDRIIHLGRMIHRKISADWVSQVIINPDGNGSYLACTQKGLFTNDSFNAELKSLLKNKGGNNNFFVYEIDSEKSFVLRAAQNRLTNALKYMHGKNYLIAHFGPNFI